MRQRLDKRWAKPPRLAKKAARLVARKPGETCCLIEGGDTVSPLDQLADLGWKLRRQTEAEVDGGKQLGFEGPVVERQRRLEGANQVTNDVFRRIVDEGREPEPLVQLGLKLRNDRLDEQTMLGNRESMFALGLSVPTGDASEPVGDILDLDIERRRVEQV